MLFVGMRLFSDIILRRGLPMSVSGMLNVGLGAGKDLLNCRANIRVVSKC